MKVVPRQRPAARNKEQALVEDPASAESADAAAHDEADVARHGLDGGEVHGLAVGAVDSDGRGGALAAGGGVQAG